MPTIDNDTLRTCAQQLLTSLHLCLLPMTIKAYKEFEATGDPGSLRTQERMPLWSQLYMSACNDYGVAFLMVKLLAEEDEIAKRAIKAFQGPNDDTVGKDLHLKLNQLLVNVERALKLLFPDWPTDVTAQGEM